MHGVHVASRTLLAGVACIGVALSPGCSDPVAQASLGTRDLLARERGVRLLDVGTLLRRVELAGGGSLRLVGRADGPGSLTARVSRVDATGEPSQPAGEAEAAAPVAGPVEAVLQLPDPGPSPLEIEVSWRGQPGGTSCTLESAVVTEREPRSKPSIIFVSIDTLAAGHMSLHGYARRTTPRLEELAQESIVFDDCITNATWTSPSYVSQFTGLYPLAFRLDDTRKGPAKAEWNNWVLPEERWTMAEMLAAAGYRTAAFVDNLMIAPGLGMPQGFEVYDMTAARRPKGDVEGGIHQVMPLALDWLDGLAPGEPYFLFVQAFDVHGPYLPGKPWAGRFRGDGHCDEQATAKVGQDAPALGVVQPYIVKPLFPKGQPLPERVRTAPLIAAYDEEILMVDDALGGFFDALRERDLLDEAIIIFSADHGEAMCEHAQLFGHNVCYDEVLHVPLLIRLPGGRGGGQRVDQTVQLVDLYPTVAELAGLRADRPYLHGRSLAPLLEGGSLPPVPTLSSEGWLDAVAVTFDGWKLIETRPAHHVERGEDTVALLVSSPRAEAWFESTYPEARGRETLPEALARYAGPNSPADLLLAEMLRALQGPFQELYSMREDPREVQDLAASRPERLAQLRQVLQSQRQRAYAARGGSEAGAAYSPSAEDLEQLRQLGYVGER
ncbi:MAG TPA: sulfatase [Planctomycetota bacterium]|nr:sulfatase [Planctomycetota bacterium]